ncbi:hypothetical protein [Aliikangiella sp. IMCC44359]|uniref:hypothetical protein n=1 Tax=Aliikangiella sp. IMCC44359 TaxID=3459125 RepID=UPI00403B2869
MFDNENFQQSSQLGRLVIKKGWISAAELEVALTHQASNDCKLGQSLIELGYISVRQLNTALRNQKWLRSIFAGVVMISAPICPVLANEKSDNFRFVAQTQAKSKVKPLKSGFMPQSKILSTKFNEYEYRVSVLHQFSTRSGVSLGIEKQDLSIERFSESEAYFPQISFYTSNKGKSLDIQPSSEGDKKPRHDRYKNTIPPVYRLTLKGYSIYEKSDEHIQFWGLNKVKNNPYKKYELMFSITKHF